MTTEEFLYESAIIIRPNETIHFRKYKTGTGRVFIREIAFRNGEIISTKDFFEQKDPPDIDDGL